MCKQHRSNMHDEKVKDGYCFGHIYQDAKIACDSLRGMEAGEGGAAACGMTRKKKQQKKSGSPHAVPFLPQYSQCPQRQDAHTSKFVLLQPPSLFSFPLSLSFSLPLSLRWRSSVSPLLPLSLFFSLTPPLFPAIGGLVVVVLFESTVGFSTSGSLKWPHVFP